METTERKIPVDPRSTVLGPRSSRPVPYDTGKVKIGCMYQPKQKWEASADMERLQTVLLNQPGPSFWQECRARIGNLLKTLGAR